MDPKSASSTPPAKIPEDSEPMEGDAADKRVTESGQQTTVNDKGSLTSPAGQVKTVELMGVPIVALTMDGQERLCLAQISATLLKQYSYNEIHNRRVALGITCVQCTPVQLEILRRAGAMPVSSRRCGMITKREAERLCKSFLTDNSPPKLPDNFSFDVQHQCAWGCRGKFMPSRYNSSRAKCVQCIHCRMFFSPNKFIFHSHRFSDSSYTQPDAANFNSWRRHLHLTVDADRPDHISHAWEDVKAMFNGGTRKRFMIASLAGSRHTTVPKKVVEPVTKAAEQHKPATAVSGLRRQSSSGVSNSQRKTNQGGLFSAFPSSANAHSTLYCSPHPYSQQEFPPNFSWLCGPHTLYPYAALAAAAAASQHTSHAASLPGCWLPYSPLFQPASTANQLVNPPALISQPLGSLDTTAVPDDSVVAATSQEPRGEDSTPESGVDMGQRKGSTDASDYERLSKEKLQELLVSEIRTRQRLESDLIQLKGGASKRDSD